MFCAGFQPDRSALFNASLPEGIRRGFLIGRQTAPLTARGAGSTVAIMRWSLGLAIVCVFAGGCAAPPPTRPDEASRLFAVVSMQLDTFSKLKSWINGTAPDGVEGVVEFDDAFGDRTKAAGTILFELYDYRAGWPDPRGARVVNPFSASLMTFDEQRAHWDRASGAYIFRLACGQLAWANSYVLSATYEPPAGSGAGGRLFSQIVIPARKIRETSGESNTPGTAAPGRDATQP